MLGVSFPSEFDNPARYDPVCEVQKHITVKSTVFDVVHHLVERAGARSLFQLPEFCLVDEEQQEYGFGDETTLAKHGRFVPLGVSRAAFYRVDPGTDTKLQSRIVFDLGHGAAIHPTGVRLNVQDPDDVTKF